MKKPSDTAGDYNIGDLLGLGSHSVRKNYYPALQKHIEELEQERNRYKWLFENALHGIFQGNLRGGFLACNPAMARLCGYDSPDTLVRSVIRLREQLFCRAAEFDAIRQELLDNGGRLQARETRFRRADGSEVHVAVTLLRRPDLGPEVVEAFVADITERVQARQKLEQLNQELEKRVEERTRALRIANSDLRHQIRERERVEQELVVAIEAAREANRSKDKYLAAASHDLLQPLNAARLMISALQDSRLPEAERRMVHQVHRALEGAEELLTDLLDISRLDQQTMTPDLSTIDVADLLQALAEEFQAVADHGGLRFRSRLRPALVRTDPRMLTRIVRNLLSNAFRYTRRGGVLLALRRRRNQLCIEVWDTGVGIEADQLQEIFVEFRQLRPQGTGGRQGVGLGLAIVERMAHILGYRVEVASRPGQGSRFRVILPLAENCGGEVSAWVPPPAPAQDLAGIRVLVIDNDPGVLESMAALLQRWGCEVYTASSEQEALAQFGGQVRPAVILADYHLDDGLTGDQMIAVLRQRLNRQVPAAVITADRSDQLLRRLREQGLPVLNKPVRPNRLRALLTGLVSTPA